MTELDRNEIFDLYESEVNNLAVEIADELRERNKYDSLNGREWCVEHDVPESAFGDAVNWYIDGIDWGISPMYPFRNEEEVVVDVNEEEEEDDDV